MELDLSKLPEGTPRIAGAEVKWGKGTGAYRDTKSAVAEDLPDETVASLQQTAVAVFQALELRDYARIDMRLRPDGRVAVIEANPNPWLASKAEFAMAARKTGRTYTQLIGEIVELASAPLRRDLTRAFGRKLVPWLAKLDLLQPSDIGADSTQSLPARPRRRKTRKTGRFSAVFRCLPCCIRLYLRDCSSVALLTDSPYAVGDM